MGASYQTKQEEFWAGEFGDAYIARNGIDDLVPTKRYLFGKILACTRGVSAVLELGANVGANLAAIHDLLPKVAPHAVEINPKAVSILKGYPWLASVTEGSFLDQAQRLPQVDLSFTSGVLIHINPDNLPQAYDALYRSSRRYVLVNEYYNPTPVVVPYRGHEDRLFKRDFAGELMARYKDLQLVAYGFGYRHDPNFPLDDMSWFLMEKR